MSKFDKVIGYEDIKAEGRLCEMANELFDMMGLLYTILHDNTVKK